MNKDYDIAQSVQRNEDAESFAKWLREVCTVHQCLSLSRLKKVRHAGESRHPGAGNRETRGSWILGYAGMTKEEIEFESMVLERTRFG
jgi:hypothetical protein